MRRTALLLMVFGGGLLTASGAWADDIGYVDCSAHPGDTAVLAKAAKTDEVVASVACGERFTVLVSSFFFSRIQTRDGKVGYVLTSSVSHDTTITSLPKPLPPLAPAKAARSGNPFSAIAEALRPKQQQGLRVPGPSTTAPATPPSSANEDTAAVSQAAPARPAAAAANFSDKTAVIVQSDTNGASQTQDSAAQAANSSGTVKVGVGETFVLNKPANAANTPASKPQSTQPAAPTATASATSTSTSAFPAKSAVVVQADTTSGSNAQRKAKELAADAALEKATGAQTTAAVSPSAPKQNEIAPTQSSNVSVSVTTPSLPEKPVAAVQPEPSASSMSASEPNTAAQPEASPATPPGGYPVQPASFRGHGVLSGRTREPRREPLIELFGGFAFARMNNGGGVFSNFNGAIGSFGWNATSWLQVVADSSYNVVTTNGVKNVLYGNHYGPRFFLRGHHRWGATPFVEGLIGGSRVDTTVAGASGYTSSTNCISIKAGGGLDLKPSRHVELRLINIDYYRTAFGTNVQQSNYWASAGIVLRFLGGSAE